MVALTLHAQAAKGPPAPSISGFSPTIVWKGATVAVRGKGFVPGRGKNRVVLRGGPGKADDVRVVATAASNEKHLTFKAPAGHAASGGGAVSGPIQVANANGVGKPSKAKLRYDSDRDGLTDDAERRLGTDPASADSDRDGIPDRSDPDPTHAQAPPPTPNVDTEPPDTAIDSAPHGATAETMPSFAFHASEQGSSFQCSIDEGTPSFSSCSGPNGTHSPPTPLSLGAHVFRVRAIDSAGNVDPSPAAESFQVVAHTCSSPGPDVAGAGLTSTFEGLENITAEGRSLIGHGAYGGQGFVEICLLRKRAGEPDSSFQVVRTSSSPAQGALIDGQRPEKGTDYVFRTDVITPDGRIPGANTITARGAGSIAGTKFSGTGEKGWAQLEENCTHCGSTSVQAGSLRSTVRSDGAGPGADVGEIAVFEDRVALGWHQAAVEAGKPEQAGAQVSTRVLVPLSPSAAGTHLGAQLNLSVEHPATMRAGDGTAVDLRDSNLPWISAEARRNADGSVVVLVRDSAGPGPDDLVAESPDLLAEGLQNIYLTIQLSAPDRYEVRYKPNTQEPDEDVRLDLAPGDAGVADRALPGPMPEAWLSLANEMSRAEVATHDVRFDQVDAVYQTDYREEPVDDFGGAGDNIQVPAGFSADSAAKELHSPTAIDFDAAGDMYVALRDGKIMRLPADAALGATEADLEEVLDMEAMVNSGPNDHGLTALVLDPDFETNGFLYTYYTVQKADTFEDRTVSRVERFHVGAGGTIELGDPLNKILVGADAPAPDTGNPSTNDTCPPGPSSDCLPSDHYTHSSGGLRFGSDGNLWISTPDGASPDGIEANGTDHLSMRAIDPDSLAGKILRVDPATGAGVPGNPEYATSSNKSSPRARTWASGFRNPFRLAERPDTGTWYATDVGWGAWEEVDAIPGTSVPGQVPNYGWPCYEGAPASPYLTLYPSQCGAITPRPPLWAYDSSGVDHAVIGAAFYTGSAFPAPWKPGAGEAAFFYGDYPSGQITMVKTDAEDELVSPGGVQSFASGFTSPVMLTEGPVDRADPGGEKTLYLVDLGPFDAPGGKIWRITYDGP